jgi:hypothetical protein
VWHRRRAEATLDDVVEFLDGFALALMGIRATLEDIVKLLGDEGDDEP